MNCNFSHQRRGTLCKNPLQDCLGRRPVREPKVSRTGFSLAELLLSISIISILITLFIVVLDPEEHFASVRNRMREQHISMFADALTDYITEEAEGMALLAAIPTTTPQEICSASLPDDCTGLLNLIPLIQNNYLAEIPRDPSMPKDTDLNRSGYTVLRVQGQHLRFAAPLAESDETIEFGI